MSVWRRDFILIKNRDGIYNETIPAKRKTVFCSGIIIEIKYAETGNLEAVSKDALKQIEDRRYEEQLLEEGVEHILKYGIAFYKKKCKVMAVK